MITRIVRAGEMNDAPLRIVWILFCLLALPSLLGMLGIPEAVLSLLAVTAALPGCIASPDKMGIHRLEVADLKMIAGCYFFIIFTSALINPLWIMLLHKLGIPFSERQEIVLLLMRSAPWARAMIFISGCLLTPLVEEVLFRRLIYAQWLKLHAKSAFAGTMVIFALLHFFVLGIPGLLIMGGCFQYIFLKRQNLLSAVCLHALVNSIAFSMSLLI